MQLLLTLREWDFNPQAPHQDAAYAKERRAARAVLLDARGAVYLLFVSKHNYHKLPGGGINDGETIPQALARELMEEVGCKADIVTNLGSIIEYRDYPDGGLRQTSYCYLAAQSGEQVAAALETGELEDGMYEVKAASIEEAIKLLTHDKPDYLGGEFIRRRDLCFLQAARDYLNTHKTI